MKIKNRYTVISLLAMNFVNGQPIQNSSLPFENNEITVEKLMAGMVVLFVYFIPTIISRDKKNWKYIFTFNLLTAWTIIGWFISFAWSLNAKSKTVENLESINKNSMELGIFRNFWDGQPNHLPFLSLRNFTDEPKEFNLKLSISKLDSILENSSEESIIEGIKLLLEQEDWRLHLVASITLLKLKQTIREKLIDYFWLRINKGSWISPQLLVTLSFSDIEFKEKSKKILNQGLKINYSVLPEIEHHVSRGGTPKSIAEKKIIASLDYLINDIIDDTSDNDSGASICKGWKENLDKLVQQNKIKLEQFQPQ